MAASVRIRALVLGLLAGAVLGSAVLFAAGVSRDDALCILARAFGLVPALEPPVERRAPCEIDPPRLTETAFDRRSLVVEASTTPEAEVEALLAELGRLESAMRDLDVEKTRTVVTDLEERRALFPVRFGRKVSDVRGGTEMRDKAQRLLAELSSGELHLADWSIDADAAIARACLLDLAGWQDNAEVALRDVHPGHWCGTCLIGIGCRLNDRRSEAAERRGDLPGALAYWDLSRINGSWAVPRADRDARIGLLLLEARRTWEGACLLQQVVDLQPRTAGAEVARAALAQIGALREPEPARLRRMYVEGRAANDPLRELAEQALGG